MNRDRLRQVLALTSIVVAALATIATSPPRSQLVVEASTDVVLTPDQPVTTRLLHVELAHGGAQLNTADLTVYGGREEPADTASWISLHTAEAGSSMLDSELGSVQSMSLVPECSAGCSTTYLVVVRLNSSTVASGHAGRLSASVSVSYVGASASPPPGARAVVEFEDPDPANEPASLRVGASGRLAISTDTPRATWHGTLVVPASALPVDGGRRIGIVWLTGSAGAEVNDIAHEAELTVGSASRGLAVWGGPLYPTAVEWRSQCTPGADCRLPVTVTISLDPESNQPSALDFRLDARLEYLDATSPPQGAGIDLIAD